MNLLVGKRKQNPTLGHVYLPRYLKHAWQVLPFAVGRHVPLDETAGVDHFDGSPGVVVMTAGGKPVPGHSAMVDNERWWLERDWAESGWVASRLATGGRG